MSATTEGRDCPCCHGYLSQHPGYVRCVDCGWLEETQRRQVMNPPADEAEAGNLVHAAPLSSDSDDQRRGLSGMTSEPEARPVTATAQLK
jgi:hypothetical protein